MKKSFIWGALLGGVSLALGGCSSIPELSKVSGPNPVLMQPPVAFPKVGPGDDARVVLVGAAEAHATNARRLRALQRYVRATRE